MVVKLNKNVKLQTVNEIPMLFNLGNSLIIGLDNEGYSFIKGMPYEKEELNGFSDNINFLFKHMEGNGFLDDYECEDDNSVGSAYLHVTNRCNLNCVGCYSMNDSRNIAKDKSLAFIKKEVDELVRHNVKTIVISGGETLIRKDIVDICKYIKDREVKELILITNGTIVNNHVLKHLNKYVDEISVSIDTFDNKTKGYIRDDGIHDRIIKNINKFLEHDFKVNILPTIHQKNVKDMYKFKELADRLGVSISFSMITTDNSNQYSSLIFNKEGLNDLSIALSELNGVTCDVNAYKSLETNKSCGVGDGVIAISSDGDIYPCHMLMLEGMSLGNLKDITLSDAIESQQNSFFKNYIVDDLKGCKNCNVRYLCGGGCRARAYLHTGEKDGKDPYCGFYYKFYNNLIKELEEAL